MTKKEKAIEASKTNPKNYYLDCYSFALHWVKNTTKKTFSSEDIIDDFKRISKLAINDFRVFGAVIRELVKDKLISHYGYAKYKNKSGHGKPTNVWIKY